MKSKAIQSGYATLLVTSILLLLALVVSLASSRGLFYQIKIAQNEVKARQAHWKAEGGLECAYSINKVYPNQLPTAQDYSLCTLSNVVSNQSVSTPENFVVNSTADGYYSLEKTLKRYSRVTGAIQSRSDLMLIGSYTFTPEFIDPNVCVSVRFKTSVRLKGAFVTTDPGSNVCGASYKTNTQKPDACIPNDANCSGTQFDYDIKVVGNNTDYIGDGKMLAHDFIHDATLDSFESFFGKPKDKIESVRAGFNVIQGTVGTSGGSCQERVRDAFVLNNKVWVKGDCDLEDGSELAPTKIGSTPKVLVVENGLLAVSGAYVFNGMVYHLFSSAIGDMTSKWTSDVSVSSGLGLLSTDEKKKLTFFTNGAFAPTGGYVFDTVGGLSVFNSAVDLDFDASAIPALSNKATWLKGSWNDF
ncbi:TPA: hypothetical protein I7748_23735 [Vibrio vulnificus]|nr:hypothetical protein [Vibrio vulnificus]HAS8515812.1 hypothetical protein [Vibrio vulnificus]